MKTLAVIVGLVLALPAFVWGAAHVDTLQYGIKPDNQFQGIDDATIRNTAASSSQDTLNFGGATTITVGTSAAKTDRFLIRLTPGAYLPSTALIDSAFMELTSTGAGVPDSLLGAICLMPWVEGAGTGLAGEIAGVTANSFGAVTLVTDSLWGLQMADSNFATWGSTILATPRAQNKAGRLNWAANEDRGYWIFLGTFSGAASTTTQFDVTDLVRYTFNSLGASNYGWIFRQQYETVAASHSHPFASTEVGDATSPRFIIYWQDNLKGPTLSNYPEVGIW